MTKPKPYTVMAPRTPGARPAWIGEYETIEDARAAARDHSRGERWLRGMDVWIERGGQRVEFAGLGS